MCVPAAQLEQLAGIGVPLYREKGEQMRLQAADAGFVYVSACECVAAGCNGKDCTIDDTGHHPRLYECAVKIFQACQDLMEVSPRKWPRYAVPMVKRYLPSMRVCFGEEDIDVRQVEAKIVNNKKQVIPSSGDPGPEPAKSPATKAVAKKVSKNNNKKKRGKKK
jgi:hypothetical protein